jgi:hypothetical protein
VLRVSLERVGAEAEGERVGLLQVGYRQVNGDGLGLAEEERARTATPGKTKLVRVLNLHDS